MSSINVTIDGQSVAGLERETILQTADVAGIYIPRLCFHPDLPVADEIIACDTIYQGDNKIDGEKPDEKAHCNFCLVEVNGETEPVNSCTTVISDGMIIRTDTAAIIEKRKQALSRVLADHPHACLTCAQKEGCSRVDCSSNVPVDERCCVLLGNCELEKVSDFIGIPGNTNKYHPLGRAKISDDPLFNRDYNLCIGCLRCVRVCGKLHDENILGAVWKENRYWVGTIRVAGLIDAQCRFCTACVEVCPTGALLDKENVPALKTDMPPPCVRDCPAGIDIPGYVQAIANGDDALALEIIRKRVPFPAILGYVCFHPCEDVCRRGEIDAPVSICSLKRYSADASPDIDLANMPEIKTGSGKKVAIIGSGPTGLTAAYYLRTLGHRVTLFERDTEPGGMLRHGIPEYRLPAEILKRELRLLEKIGINFQTDYRLEDNGGIKQLKSDGYDAILLAVGVSASKVLPIENSSLENIYPGLEFLKNARGPEPPKLTGSIIIIGGGNVAIDAAMTAIRLGAGAAEVHLVCLESRADMPAHDWEIKQAEEEGVIIHPAWGPRKFLTDNDRLSGIEFRQCTRVFDENGRFSPMYDENKTKQLKADTAVITIGQEVDPELFGIIPELSKSRSGVITTENDLSIGIEAVFAAGDSVRGPSSVINAIADGRTVADKIDSFLGGAGLDSEAPLTKRSNIDSPDGTFEDFRQVRQKAPVTEINERVNSFVLIEQTMNQETARVEASRCLHCNLRLQFSPVTLPPERYLPFNRESIDSLPETDGVIQLLNSDKKVVRISGTQNIKKSLLESLENKANAEWFIFEEDPMYTKRESELIQQYLQKYGKMPGSGDGGGGGGDDLDDLF